MFKIYELELHEKGVIRVVNCEEEIKERLASFGVVPGLVFEINQKYDDNALVIGWESTRISIIEMFGKNILVDKVKNTQTTPADKRLSVLRAMNTIIDSLENNEPKEDWHMFIAENTKITDGGASTLSQNPKTYEEACKLFTNLISSYGKNSFKYTED
jgi:Fe2+ transport system protein FeoA